MTEQELQAIKERVEKATRGPWKWEQDFLDCEEFYSEDEHEIITAGCGQNVGFVHIKGNDAEFIAHAREDVPTLIAEVKRYKELFEICEKGMLKANDMLKEAHNKLDCTELAEVKVRMEVERLREALSYYADKLHYEPYFMKDGTCDVTEDEGYIARQALEEGLNEQG